MSEKLNFKSLKKDSINLNDSKESLEFYEERYSGDYMRDWPESKKKKVAEIINELDLPEYGEALDFGCGNGVFTDVIRSCLPKWKVYGTDLSTNAIKNAKNRFPNCIFFDNNDKDLKNKSFDFLFTNHVIEHVFDINEVFYQMNNFLKKNSYMLHFLPCGNPNSYEYNICTLRKDGINPKIGNRFFFEDEGHVRRLTTEEFRLIAKNIGFNLEKSFYSNQYYGAINWITNDLKTFLIHFFNTSMAINKRAKSKLRKERNRLLPIAILRFPFSFISRKFQSNHKSLIDYVLIILSIPFYLFSKQINNYWESKALLEWQNNKNSPNGSEMALFLKR